MHTNNWEPWRVYSAVMRQMSVTESRASAKMKTKSGENAEI